MYRLTGLDSNDGFHHVIATYSSDNSGRNITRRGEVGDGVEWTQMRDDYIDAHPDIAENEFVSEISILRYQAELEADDNIEELDDSEGERGDEE